MRPFYQFWNDISFFANIIIFFSKEGGFLCLLCDYNELTFSKRFSMFFSAYV